MTSASTIAADLLSRFGLRTYSYGLEAAVHAGRDAERSEALEWFAIADAVEALLGADDVDEPPGSPRG
jgi:hypothetical protein